MHTLKNRLFTLTIHLFYITSHEFMLPLLFKQQRKGQKLVLENVSSVAKNDMPLFQWKKKCFSFNSETQPSFIACVHHPLVFYSVVGDKKCYLLSWKYFFASREGFVIFLMSLCLYPWKKGWGIFLKYTFNVHCGPGRLEILSTLFSVESNTCAPTAYTMMCTTIQVL